MGTVCDVCGTPLPGHSDVDERPVCDECLRHTPVWSHGRAALRYGGSARQMILGFKHGDRLDLARPLGAWVARAAADLILPQMIVAPIPLHRSRLLKRKYNQSVLLGKGVARAHGITLVPDLLIRRRATPPQEGLNRAERLANVTDAIVVNPRRAALLKGRPVLLVDDVMTSGATFTVATLALKNAGVSEVRVVALARVANDV